MDQAKEGLDQVLAPAQDAPGLDQVLHKYGIQLTPEQQEQLKPLNPLQAAPPPKSNKEDEDMKEGNVPEPVEPRRNL